MGKGKIIIIEDQEDLAELYEASLRRAGYEVFKAYTGEEGVSEFEDNGADAILLDMTLPEMHGTETLQQIRALNARIPVVVATGESSDDTREQIERLGVLRYLSKPIDYDELARVFGRALSDPATTTEEYEVVTLRLPARVVKLLNEVDSNLERAVTRLCEEKAKT